jgi:ABC-type lipoprotein release transport system permease subunit
MLLRLAWRNLFRNKRRTALTLGASVFATLLSFVNLAISDGSHERWIEHAVRLYPGHFEVSLRGYREERTLDYALPLGATELAALDGLPDGARWAPRLESFGLISADRENASGRAVQLFGVDPAREEGLSRLLGAITSGRMAAPADGARELVLGDKLAENLRVAPGDDVIVVSADAYGSQSADRFRVVGLMHVGDDAFDGYGALVDLGALQSFLEAPGSVSHVAVFERHGDDGLAPIGAALRARFPADRYEVLDWQELMPDLVQFMLLDDAGNWVGNLVLIVVVGFGLLNTILMSVLERTRELGVLRALGLRPRAVFELVMLESILLTLAGMALGFGLAIPLVAYLAKHPIPLGGGNIAATTEVFDLEPVIAFGFARDSLVLLPAVLICVGLFAALPPAIRAARGRPVDALRET